VTAKVLNSPKLLGITRIDEYHRDGTEMRSTGNMRFSGRGNEQDPRSWTIEYASDAKGDYAYSRRAADLDLIREVLRDAGILPNG
jgi:hypothetical protein